MDHVRPYTEAPLVVIGNGPAGETTSLLLARWGIPVIVLDGRPERDLIGSNYKDRELFRITLADAGQSEFPSFVNISQSRTEEALAEKMADNPLIEQRWGHKVTTISKTSRA